MGGPFGGSFDGSLHTNSYLFSHGNDVVTCVLQLWLAYVNKIIDKTLQSQSFNTQGKKDHTIANNTQTTKTIGTRQFWHELNFLRKQNANYHSIII